MVVKNAKIVRNNDDDFSSLMMVSNDPDILVFMSLCNPVPSVWTGSSDLLIISRVWKI